MTLTVEAVKDLSKQFKAAKIKATIDEPDENLDLEISIELNETVRISPGKVDIKVFVDPAHKQLVMWADEQARTRKERCGLYFTNKHIRAAGREALTKRFEQGHGFPASLPEGTKYKIIDKIAKGSGVPGPLKGKAESPSYAFCTVEATIPKSEQTFLIGTDEHSQFVCGLPERVKTVKAAHKSLRPSDVPANAPRQGEWFFVPATAEEKKKVEQTIASDYEELGSLWLGSADIGAVSMWTPDDAYHDNQEDTSHAAYTGVLFRYKPGNSKTFRKALFVRGYVVDDRRPDGRQPRHKPLWLHDWHRVVRNLEINVPGQDSETWD